jgi:hypothetical protein
MANAKAPPIDSQRLAEIRGRVILALGQPDNLQKVQIRHLWGDCYRANILVGADLASARIAHSYFLVTDEGGTIVASTPALVRAY